MWYVLSIRRSTEDEEKDIYFQIEHQIRLAKLKFGRLRGKRVGRFVTKYIYNTVIDLSSTGGKNLRTERHFSIDFKDQMFSFTQCDLVFFALVTDQLSEQTRGMFPGLNPFFPAFEKHFAGRTMIYSKK